MSKRVFLLPLAITPLLVLGFLGLTNHWGTQGPTAASLGPTARAEPLEADRTEAAEPLLSSVERLVVPVAQTEPPAKNEDPSEPTKPLTDEERWLAEYSQLKTYELEKLVIDLEKEHSRSAVKEVGYYIASGLATKVPQDQIGTSLSPDQDTIPMLATDDHGDGYTFAMKREHSPDLFAQRDRLHWLKRYVHGVDSNGKAVQPHISYRRGEATDE